MVDDALLTAALEYAARGWAIHPLRPGDKRPLLPDWPNRATLDPETIRSWWQRWPGANIGLSCGSSGVVAIDLDTKSGADGLASWQALGVVGDTVTSCTPSGGRHLVYQNPNGATIRNSAGKLGPGIDVRGDGGYIVLPPSVVGSRPYGWVRSPADGAPAPLPLVLVTLLKDPPPPVDTEPAAVGNVSAYTRTALDGELATVRAATTGSRNRTLNKAAYALGQLVGAGMLNRATAEIQLEAAALAVGLGQHEARRTIKSGLDAGKEQPRQVDPAPATRQPASPSLAIEETPQITTSPATVATEARPRRRRLTDLGNAERLVDHHGDQMRYCHPWGKWLTWNGQRWALDDTAQVVRWTKDTVRKIYTEITDDLDDEKAKKIANWAIRSQFKSRIMAMIDLAQSEPSIPILPEGLDADPWLLATENGTLDLRTGQLRASRPADLITKIAPLEFDPDAQAPTWVTFLQEIMDGDAEMIAFLQRAVGYSLTGDTREQVLFILYGSGANGKSTFLETLSALLGDYSHKTPTETLLVKRGGGVPNDVARLRGARLVTAVEAEEDQRMAESLVKQLVGGDTIAARFLHREWFEFKPEFKLFLATNHRPVIRGTDNAIWRRIRLIPFEVTIPETEQDKELPNKLKQELPGILAWALQGCLTWQRQGLGVPRKVSQATAAYQAEMDVLVGFLEDCCLLKPTAWVPIKALYEVYTEWCGANGEHPIGKRIFGGRLTERGMTQGRTGNARFWKGIGLLSDPEQLDLPTT